MSRMMTLRVWCGGGAAALWMACGSQQDGARGASSGTSAVPERDPSGVVRVEASPAEPRGESAEAVSRSEFQVDPMKIGKAERSCGEAKPNPHGFILSNPEYPVPPVDGTCAVCERPPDPIPGCAPGIWAQPLTWPLIRNRKGKTIQVEAALGFEGVRCMGVGSSCRCASRCSTRLSVFPAGMDYVAFREAPKPPPSLILTLPFQLFPNQEPFYERWKDHLGPHWSLGCGGDEASVCCPLDFNRETKLERVIVRGTVHELEDPHGWDEPALAVESICRPGAPPGLPWAAAQGAVQEPAAECTGTLSIETSEQALVLVDRIWRGPSPVRALALPAGEYEVTFLHLDWGILLGPKVQIACGQDTAISRTLQPSGSARDLEVRKQEQQAAWEKELSDAPCTGTLDVDAIPQAYVVLDGKMRARTPQSSFRIPAGKHNLLLTRNQMEHHQEVTVGCGTRQRIHVELERTQE